MAIDTALKRRSISGIPFLIPGVTPDATPGQEWRQSAGWSYGAVASTFVYSLRNHAIFSKFRDKRIMAEFRDKRIAVKFRDKRIVK